MAVVACGNRNQFTGPFEMFIAIRYGYMSKEWFKQYLIQIATDHIDRVVDSSLITQWEIDSLKAAANNGLINSDSGHVNLPDGRQWSLMTLNREYLAHLAIYFELISSCEFNPDFIKLEHQHMDLVIFDKDAALIAIEVKKSETEGAKLIKGILAICQNPPLDDHDRGVDALRKVKCLLSIHPKEFWIVTPTMRWKFEIQYIKSGFKLIDLTANKAA